MAEPQGCFSPPDSILPTEAQLQTRSYPEPERARQNKLLSLLPRSADLRQQYLSCRVAAKPQQRPMIITPYASFKTFPILVLWEKTCRWKNLTKKNLTKQNKLRNGHTAGHDQAEVTTEPTHGAQLLWHPFRQYSRGSESLDSLTPRREELWHLW